MPRVLFALLATLCFTYSAAAVPPNVLIVLTDDQGYGDLGVHGNPVLKTPNLDKLHAESIRLTDFHVCPMCTPTRGQLLTGVDCLRNGAMNVSSGRTLLRRGIPTLADLFAANGYRTGQFGKWHLGDNYPFRPQDRGFHESLCFPSSHIGSAPDFWNNHYFDDTYVHNGRREKYSGDCTDVFFGEALKWMKNCVDNKQPFFTYLATNAPHGPLFVPIKHREKYADQKPPVARFFGMLDNIDENLGRLEAFLRETGLKENTVLIFLTDNGGTAGVPVFNAGMRGKKIDLYEGGHRVPCFVRWPSGKLRKAGDVAELTQVQDLAPTLVELCGLKPPSTAAFDGANLAGLLRGTVGSLADRMLVIQFSRMNAPKPVKGDACVLWKRWRLVQEKELYDLAADPEQKTDVSTRHSDVAAKMRAHYEAWWSGVEPRVNDHEAVIVGAETENPLQLSAADWEDVFLDQGAQVRAGLRRNGPWNVEVARAGQYEITLRRWPAEAEAAIRAGRPPVKHTDGEFPAGVALPIASARLKIADFDTRKPVTDGDKAVAFTLPLRTGRTQLRTWFDDANGKEICGAYYVTVKLLAADQGGGEVRPAPKRVGLQESVGCNESPKRVDRLEITKSGVYENYLVDSNWGSGNRVKITADDVTMRHCEIRNATGNGIGVFGKNVTIESCKIHHLLAGSFKDQKDAHGITGRWNNVTIRNCEIYYVSGDCVQFDPDRKSTGEVLIEDCALWTGPLPEDVVFIR